MMNVGIDFLQIVFFIYGLAFFVLGLATALECRRASPLMLASSLPFLAAFGLLHSVVVWTDMFLLVPSPALELAGEEPVRVTRTILLAASTVALIQFGVKLIVGTLQRQHWLRFLPLSLFAVWLFSLVIPHLFSMPSGALERGEGLCPTCHGGQSNIYLTPSGNWITSADVWARYLLYLPGSLLAAIALLTQRSLFRGMRLPVLARDCTWGAAAFALNALVAGLIVPPAPYFPASVLNYASFFALVQIPPQIFRAASALAIAFFVVSVLRIFEIEQQRRLQRANEERLQAQEQALEAQRQAQQQLEQWARELELRVEQRTQEVERRDRELAVLEERDRIAREMHDSLGQILGYLSLKLMSLEHDLASSKLTWAVSQVRQMAEAVQQATADVRNSILSLRTTVPPDGTLVPALNDYVAKLEEQTGLSIEVVISDNADQRLSLPARVQVLRIIQEALTNVRKHAGAGKVWVRFETENNNVRIGVEDDGCGFDAQSVEQASDQHFGLQTMRERAGEVGGTFTIDSSPGRGTRVIVTIPETEEE